jgi:DNA-binding PadR family transcriptional regulator
MKTHLRPAEKGVLLELFRVAQARDGWKRRQVSGWLFIHELVEPGTEYVGPTLADLYRWGLVEKVDVREQGTARPVNLYRITARGLAALGIPREELDLPLPAHEPHEERTLYVPRAAWGALEALRRQLERGLGCERFGEEGWMNAGEIHAAGQTVLSDDLAWLARRELVERRPVPDPRRPRSPMIVYRATARGRAAEKLQARGGLVHARVPPPSSPPREPRPSRTLASVCGG